VREPGSPAAKNAVSSSPDDDDEDDEDDHGDSEASAARGPNNRCSTDTQKSYGSTDDRRQ
jgi:hypothetical protein